MDILKDGKVNLHKVFKAELNFAEFGGTYEKFTECLIEEINDYIESLVPKQTPITAELLERSGFDSDPMYSRFISDQIVVTESMLVWWDRPPYAPIPFVHIETMEELSELNRFYTGNALDWQDNRASELRKRLLALGLVRKEEDFFLGHFGKKEMSVRVTLTDDLRDIDYVDIGNQGIVGIKTIGTLEAVINEMKED